MINYQNELNRCVTLVKSDPISAINEMAFLREDSVYSPLREKQWIKAAVQINSYLDSLEKTRYYKESEFWKKQKPARLEI